MSPEDSDAPLIDRFARTPKIKPGGVDRARRLRSEPTRTEARLWQHLRKLEVRFRRQAPIGPYIVDFACHSAKLVIEVDGGVHNRTDVALRDLTRDEWLISQGYRVLRFPTQRVEREIDTVVAKISKAAGAYVPPGFARASTPSQLFPLEGKGSSEI
ncbi:endonuclease domain-containing protein [Brevundimonas sp. AAP58]|uniref:endonuclease domain-containing protein n=1 Tax=Brevundimonas sp. AAP58 TaxID=1523422 RepID=UPI0009E7D9C8|nr:endonuclease domain-containing protein [Brevundimonas sp. AAP58]